MLQILFDGGLIDFCVEQGTLDIPVPKLLAYRGHWHTGLQELAGPAVAQLVNGGFDLGNLTILLPGIVSDAVLQRQRTPTIARITTEDRTRGNMALLEVTPEQPNTFRGCREHDGAFSLPFAKDADFLIVGTQINLCRKQPQRLDVS